MHVQPASDSDYTLVHMESCVRASLDQVPGYRLASATPEQVQLFFHLLETYAHDLSTKPAATRQQLAREALALCRELVPAQLLANKCSANHC